MRIGLTLSVGVTGITFLFVAVSLLLYEKLGMLKDISQDIKNSYNKKGARFLGIVFLAVSLICVLGAILSIFELCPIPILWIINFLPAFSTIVSVFYINKSKRFKK